jgi:hypothetical protein
MTELLPFGVAFAVAFAITLLELVTSKYPRTIFLLAGSISLYAYGVVYGLIAAGIDAMLPVISDQATVSGVAISNPWVRAIAIGLSVKAFLHIRFFDVTTGPGKSFPVGVESFVQLFEPWLLRSIDLDHFLATRRLVQSRAAAYADVATARSRALANIPSSFDASERAAFENDLDNATTIERVMETYLTVLGRKIFSSVYP